MHADFWHDKWHRMEVGFHLDEVNKALIKYWPALGLAQGARVLVPLCGASLDLLWLHEQGHTVIGIELSEKALDWLAERFANERQQPLEKTATDGQVHYRGEGVWLVAGDFFDVTLDALGTIDAIYDRAALVALPDTLRQDYVRHLRHLAPAAAQLLVTLDYEQSRMAGPPFAVDDTEVEAHYRSAYAIERLDDRELIEQEPRFRARGLDSFRQRVYRLQPQPTQSHQA